MSYCKVFLPVLVGLLAYGYYKYQRNQNDVRYADPGKVIEAWNRIIKEPQHRFQRITIGINGCVDLIVDAVSVLDAAGVQPGQRNDHRVISSLEELQEAFHHHFALGAAAERYFSEKDLFNKLVQSAAESAGAQFSIGGNAALMAQKMAQSFPNLKLQLVGPIGPRLHDLLDKNVAIPEDSRTPSDEVHLILEYGAGVRWGETSSPVATRFITSHDIANSKASSLEAFFKAVTEDRPDLVVLSGLHMLEGQSEEIWIERIKTAKAGLAAIDRSIPVHLELASMVNNELMKAITSQIIPKVTSLGLNEQELSFLSHVLGGPHSDIFDLEGRPEVYKVTDILTWIFRTYGQRNHPESCLSRVHFHSLTFHILAIDGTVWSGIESAVAAGSRAASLQACNMDTLTRDLSELRIPSEFRLYSSGDDLTFDVENPVIQFNNEGYEFAFSPVLVCKKPLKTVGLGDAISATGLLYSTYKVSSQ